VVAEVEQLSRQLVPGADDGILLRVAERLLEREVLFERDGPQVS
jgi:hypothetical protein